VVGSVGDRVNTNNKLACRTYKKKASPVSDVEDLPKLAPEETRNRVLDEEMEDEVGVVKKSRRTEQGVYATYENVMAGLPKQSCEDQ
jgi:hypothetical protein